MTDAEFLTGGGDAGALMRGLEWSKTPVGPLHTWPQSLRTSVSTCLNCAFPIVLWWGHGLVQLYNDAYAPILGTRHPAALGLSAPEIWPEVWDEVGPMLDRVMTEGATIRSDDRRFVLNRHGFAEECYFSFSYSPIRTESGGIGGVFCPVLETTERVVGDRRLGLLRRLSDRIAGVRSAEESCAAAAACLDGWEGRDLPFAAFYLPDPEHPGLARLSAATGSEDGVAVPGTLRMADIGLEDPNPHCMILALGGTEPAAGFMTVRLNPHRPVAETRAFAGLVAGQVGTAIDAGIAYRTVLQQKVQLETVIETVPAAVWVTYDRQGRDVTGNRHAGAMLRMSPSANPSMQARPDMGFGDFAVHRRGVAVAIADMPIRRAARGEDVPTEEFEFVFPDGTAAAVLVRAAPLRDDRGSTIGAVCTAVDITDRKRAEAAALLSGDEFRALGENQPNLCWMAHADGSIYWYNRRWYDYTGTTPAAMEGWGWQSVHDPARLPGVIERWQDALSTGTPLEMTFPLRRADGVFRPFLTRVVPIRGPEGGITRWFGSNVDVTDQLATEAALRAGEEALRRMNDELEARVADAVLQREQAVQHLAQSHRMEALGKLAGGIAHDFNNVLQAVSGGLALIGKKAGDPDAVRRLSRMTGDAAARGAAITGRLLSFARRGELQTVAVPLPPLLDSLYEILTATLGAGIDVRVGVEAGAGAGALALMADRAQLETVLINLAVNARDAMPEGGILTISARHERAGGAGSRGASQAPGLEPGSYIRIDVADTGIGMDEATLAHASEPFFTTKPVGLGTGLGLAMARGFAQQSGGGFAITSAPGAGTVVILWFPHAAAPAAIAPGQDHAAAALQNVRARVMVVDDDAMVREVLVLELEACGYEVIAASEGLAGLALLDGGAVPDVLITDFSMPGMNGALLIEAARRRLPNLPAMLLTGYADDRLAFAQERGTDPRTVIARKPLSATDLTTGVAALLIVGKKVPLPV